MQIVKKEIWVAIKKEWQETKQAWKIAITPPYGLGKTPKETKILFKQFFDLNKILFLGALVLLPFGCVIVAVVIKSAEKIKLKVLPTAFYEKVLDK